MWCVAGCNKGGVDGAGPKTSQKQVESDNKPDVRTGIAAAIRKQKLADYDTATIGDAFDNYRYFEKREWKETVSNNGKIYIDFCGWFKKSVLDAVSVNKGIAARGIDVKFVINADGSFYLAMISKVEIGADGREFGYPQEDKTRILSAIYGNKEMSFQ
jgi:hypothetical protein